MSGMNLIISDTDHPLIIKVASIQQARMQVYFIDNDDYFGRKHMLHDEQGAYFPDNDERAVFFSRGVLETVRKLRWQPNIVHCHGWFTSLVPMYVKKAFREDPLFSKAKVVCSLYNDRFEGAFNAEFKTKAVTDGIAKKDVAVLDKPNYVTLCKLAANFSDGFVFVGDQIHPVVEEYVNASGKPVIRHDPETYVQDYGQFYDSLFA